MEKQRKRVRALGILTSSGMWCEEKLAKQKRMTGEGENSPENMESSKLNGAGVQGSNKHSHMLNAVDKSI